MKLHKSKTMNFAMILAIFGALQANLPALQGVISPAAYGWITLGVALAVAALRAVTSKPLSAK